MTTIAGKTVLLTGASRGIGVYIARALLQEQATVIGVSRSPEKLDQIADEFQDLGGQFIALPFDLSQVDALPELVRDVHQRVGPVDILINNAGIEIYRAFQDYSSSEVRSVLSTNLLGAMELSRLVLPEMLNRQGGHIVNMASLAAKKGHPYDSIYSASKAGLLMWSDAIRQELSGTGVHISVICPGYISGQGMLADTGVPAPGLSGTSKPEQVVKAVVQAIQKNQPEVIVNKDPMTVGFTKLLFAVWQFFPRFGDVVYRWMGVPQLNQLRIKYRMPSEFVKSK